MKNLIIIVGTILLGTIIVSTLVLGDGNSLEKSSKVITDKATTAITEQFGS